MHTTMTPSPVNHPVNVVGGPASQQGTAPQGTRFLDDSRFSVAIASISKATKAFSSFTGRGCLESNALSTVFVFVVGLSLVGLGIFLVVYGNIHYVIDLLVVGSLCLVVGAFALVPGFIILRNALRKKGKARHGTEIPPANEYSLRGNGMTAQSAMSAAIPSTTAPSAMSASVPSTSTAGSQHSKMSMFSYPHAQTNLRQHSKGRNDTISTMLSSDFEADSEL